MADNTTTYTTIVDVQTKGENELQQMGDTAQETGDKFTRLQRQIRDTATAMQKAAEAGDSVQFNKLKGQLDDLEDKLEITTLKSKQFDDALVAMPGPAGQAGQAIKALDGGMKALIANPVVATIAAIIGVFMLFKKSLESTAEGQETLNRISTAFGKILGPILATIEAVALPLFEGLAFVLEKVGAGFAYVADKLGISKQKISEASSGIKDFKKHNEELAKAEKDAADKRAADAKKAAEDRKRAADEAKRAKEQAIKDAEEKRKKEYEAAKAAITNAEDLKESEDKLAQARVRITDDRIKQLNQEQEFADANYRREVKRIEDLMKVINLSEDDRRKLIIERNNLEAQSITDKQNRDKSIADEEQKRKDEEAKKVEEAKKKAEEDKKLAEEEAQKKLEAEMKAREDKAARLYAEYEYEDLLKKKSFQDELNLFDQTRELERQNLVAQKASADALVAFDKATAAQRIQIERAQQEAKLAIVSNALGTIAEAVGRQTVAGKALAVAQATIDTYMGATKALATYPPPFGAIAAATVVVAGLLNVKKILSTEIPEMPKPGGGTVATGGGATAAPAIPMPTIPTLNAPGITATGGTNPTQQIASTLAGATNKPIKAYVVSGDVSSQQALDRRTSKAATF